MGLTLEGVTEKAWPWGTQFLTDLLKWQGAPVGADEVCTVSFLELAMDFEAHAKWDLPAAPQAALRGTALPHQERARVLRLALSTLGKLVKTGQGGHAVRVPGTTWGPPPLRSEPPPVLRLPRADGLPCVRTGGLL